MSIGVLGSLAFLLVSSACDRDVAGGGNVARPAAVPVVGHTMYRPSGSHQKQSFALHRPAAWGLAGGRHRKLLYVRGGLSQV